MRRVIANVPGRPNRRGNLRYSTEVILTAPSDRPNELQIALQLLVHDEYGHSSEANQYYRMPLYTASAIVAALSEAVAAGKEILAAPPSPPPVPVAAPVNEGGPDA
ncbi:MAG: hypothetical protein ACHQPI_02905 [Thermoanaerobaculia bacterium]